MKNKQQTPPRTCSECQGACGKTVETTSNGKTVGHWEPCGPCHGTGVQGGGI